MANVDANKNIDFFFKEKFQKARIQVCTCNLSHFSHVEQFINKMSINFSNLNVEVNSSNPSNLMFVILK